MIRIIRNISVVVRSFIVNLIYIVFNFYKIPKAYKKMKEVKCYIKDIENIKEIQSKFIWKKDRPIDWRPWIICVFMRNLKDDCDGAAVLGRWLLKQINISSKIYRVFNDKNSHVVTVSFDDSCLITNNQLFIIENINETQIIKYCYEQTGVKYTNIEKG